jgi:hypothetical protein
MDYEQGFGRARRMGTDKTRELVWTDNDQGFGRTLKEEEYERTMSTGAVIWTGQK